MEFYLESRFNNGRCLLRIHTVHERWPLLRSFACFTPASPQLPPGTGPQRVLVSGSATPEPRGNMTETADGLSKKFRPAIKLLSLPISRTKLFHPVHHSDVFFFFLFHHLPGT